MDIFRETFYSLADKASSGTSAMIDATIVKAHRTAASLRFDEEERKNGGSTGEKEWKGIALRSNHYAHTYHLFAALGLILLFL